MASLTIKADWTHYRAFVNNSSVRKLCLDMTAYSTRRMHSVELCNSSLLVSFDSTSTPNQEAECLPERRMLRFILQLYHSSTIWDSHQPLSRRTRLYKSRKMQVSKWGELSKVRPRFWSTSQLWTSNMRAGYTKVLAQSARSAQQQLFTCMGDTHDCINSNASPHENEKLNLRRQLSFLPFIAVSVHNRTKLAGICLLSYRIFQFHADEALSLPTAYSLLFS